jgi:glycosyltransferase involved in cell wall biosynthesis
LVCHPGRQHSHQLALALADAGMLARYVTGVPAHAHAGGVLGRRVLASYSRNYALGLDENVVSHCFIAPVVRRVADRVLDRGRAVQASHWGDGLFDAWVARRLERFGAQVVVAYENAALHTFRRAKQLGMTTVLDAASFHHAWQDRFMPPVEGPRAHAGIVRRKDAEIALADHILCTSEFARASYLDAGIDPERVHTLPMGVDTTTFRPRDREAANGHGPALRFVFVGSGGRLKGLDVLSEAAHRLRREGRSLSVTAIGPARAPTDNDGGVIEWRGRLNHAQLANELPGHDVLVLPSRFDSFGLVVAEGMACGLPAIVTEHVGAKEMVTPGENGQIVAADDAAALGGAMAWMMDQVPRLPQMRLAARASAEQYDWSAYRRKAVDFFTTVRQ